VVEPLLWFLAQGVVAASARVLDTASRLRIFHRRGRCRRGAARVAVLAELPIGLAAVMDGALSWRCCEAADRGGSTLNASWEFMLHG